MLHVCCNNNQTGKGRNRRLRRKSPVSWVIMLLLVVIALCICMKQFKYDPSLFTLDTPESKIVRKINTPSSGFPDIKTLMPPDMVVLSHMETFGANNLSDKINGKADLYLSSGFLNLQCQRFVKKDDVQSWLEVFIYDMNTIRQSFSVFSNQMRSDAQDLTLAPFAYQTGNALFFVHGRFYVEIIASMVSDPMMFAMVDFAGRFIEKTTVKEEKLYELDMFPQEQLIKKSIVLFMANAFGFEKFSNVFIARYQMSDDQLTAFLSDRHTSEDADSLVDAYRDFIVKNGGTQIPLKEDITHGYLLEIFDVYELIFSHGSYVAGVHEAEDKNTAQALGLQIKKNLDRMTK